MNPVGRLAFDVKRRRAVCVTGLMKAVPKDRMMRLAIMASCSYSCPKNMGVKPNPARATIKRPMPTKRERFMPITSQTEPTAKTNAVINRV